MSRIHDFNSGLKLHRFYYREAIGNNRAFISILFPNIELANNNNNVSLGPIRIFLYPFVCQRDMRIREYGFGIFFDEMGPPEVVRFNSAEKKIYRATTYNLNVGNQIMFLHNVTNRGPFTISNISGGIITVAENLVDEIALTRWVKKFSYDISVDFGIYSSRYMFGSVNNNYRLNLPFKLLDSFGKQELYTSSFFITKQTTNPLLLKEGKLYWFGITAGVNLYNNYYNFNRAVGGRFVYSYIGHTHNNFAPVHYLDILQGGHNNLPPVFDNLNIGFFVRTGGAPFFIMRE